MSKAARKFAKPVWVSSKTDELSEVSANPDGTFTYTTAARPQRVRRGNDWVGVDTKLRRNSDGSITRGASTVDIRLTGGSGKPFAVAGREGVEVGLSWPTALPEPRLDGDTATYPDVLPGVDLQVKATDSGFSQPLVARCAHMVAFSFAANHPGATLMDVEHPDENLFKIPLLAPPGQPVRRTGPCTLAPTPAQRLSGLATPGTRPSYQDIEDQKAYARITAPMLGLAAGYNDTLTYLLPEKGTDVRVEKIAGSGHRLPSCDAHGR